MRVISFEDMKKDLLHELRMLLGASKMCKLSEEINFGNTINYFKDAVYLHARELYYFFLETPRNNDFSIQQIEDKEVYELLKSDLWSDIQKPLNKHVFHITESRETKDVDNIINRRHLNEYVPCIIGDILDLWNCWINNTKKDELKTELINIMAEATKQAQDDYCNSLKKIKEWK